MPKSCGGCGAENLVQAQFCTSCGVRFSSKKRTGGWRQRLGLATEDATVFLREDSPQGEGFSAPAPPPNQAPTRAAGVVLPTGPRGCNVAGVSNYQMGFRGFAPGNITVELRAEPKNRYDKHAVAVHMPNGALVGYLFADYAAEIQTAILHLSAEGPVWTEATVETWDGGLGIRLQLMERDHLYRWTAATPAERAVMPTRDRRITLTGRKEYQEVFAQILGRSTTSRTVDVLLHAVETPSGKYKGQLRIDVLYKGEPIGSLLPTRREQLPELFDKAASNDIPWKAEVMHSSTAHHAEVVFESR